MAFLRRKKPFEFSCTYCDEVTITVHAEDEEKAKTAAKLNGWATGKAVLCPGCHPGAVVKKSLVNKAPIVVEGELTHDDLVLIADRWLMTAKGCSFSFAEFNCNPYNGEWPDAIGFSGKGSILVECKVSRADFLADKKKRFRANSWMGMGRFRFYMCPKGLIQPDELPEGWGLVWVNEKGKAIQKVGPKGSSWDSQTEFSHEHCRESERDMMYSALRRLAEHGVLQKIYEDASTTPVDNS